MSNIIKTTDLLQFVAGRRMQVGAFVNAKGDSFKSCILTDDKGDRCFISFSSKLGELTPREIVAMKHDLQVASMDSGTFILCKKGSNAWEDVAL